MTARLLPLPDDPRLTWLLESWQQLSSGPGAWTRSQWLKAFEDVLRPYFPQSSSRDRSLTARHHAPFFLAEGHDVP